MSKFSATKESKIPSMFGSSSASLSSLIAWCRALHHNLEAGVPVLRVFGQQAERGPVELRAAAGRIGEQLQQGKSVSSALKRESLFPQLLKSLVAVGEQTGHLSEIFGVLEQYYTTQLQVQRRFRSRAMLPAIQFVFAVFIIALVIWILGIISSSRESGPSGLFGLSGAVGALIFLVVVFGSIALLWFSYKYLLPRVQGKYLVDALLLRLPLVGPYIQALTTARFALALHLTTDSGMMITKAIRLSLNATGNSVFAAHAEEIERELKAGETLTLAMTGMHFLPEEFRSTLAMGEESGRVSEVMRQQFRYYSEETERRMDGLARLGTIVVWLIYAAFMIVMIFRLASIYFSMLGG